MTTKIMNLFSNEKMLLEHSVLSYKFDLYFPEHKLSMKVDEKGHTDRDVHNNIERQTTIEKQHDCEFVRINPNRKDLLNLLNVEFVQSH